ncbi:MAG TPA: YeeE/YedE thiosulfate transporter family protein [Symbiobacteriaceae bacterium]|nr:YeeE/YedE thiosulfate transporter family protein [Symbiobacteriaceae bacterium]
MPDTRVRKMPADLPGVWPYWVGGIALALINTLILVLDNRPWGVTTPLTHIGSRALQLLGLQPERWTYFNQVGRDTLLSQFGWWDTGLWLNVGVVAGAVLASLAAGEFAFRTGPRKWRKLWLSLLGGVLMGYGARLALGCSVGALIGGISSFSLHGWIFSAALFVGALVGIRLFSRIL